MKWKSIKSHIPTEVWQCSMQCHPISCDEEKKSNLIYSCADEDKKYEYKWHATLIRENSNIKTAMGENVKCNVM